MNIFFIVTIIIFYFLWDILTLNKEVYYRVTSYKRNINNVKVKSLCKRKTVLLFLFTAILMGILTAISNTTAILAFIVMWIINRIIRRKRLKEIKYLDEENEDYWKG